MAKKGKKQTTDKQTTGKAKHTKSRILYWIAAVVILIPVLLLGYIYLSAKESAGTPTVGSRFDNSLDPAITEEQLTKVKDALKFDGAENVEVNLKSATLRITIDLNDKAGSSKVKSVLNDAYDKVVKILPVKTYFTNQKDVRMYDLDIHVYNFIPEGDDTSGWVYKEKVKNASAKKAVTDTLSSARNKKQANKLLEEQKKDK